MSGPGAPETGAALGGYDILGRWVLFDRFRPQGGDIWMDGL